MDFAKDTVESSMTLRAVWYQYADMHEKVSLRGKPYDSALVEYRDRAGSVVYTLKASGTDGTAPITSVRARSRASTTSTSTGNTSVP